MKNKKKIFLYTLGLVFAGLLLFIGNGVADLIKWNKTKEAIAGGGLCDMWCDAGKISLVRELCVLDTPASDPVTCAISCPLVTGAVGPACVDYIELDLASQLGTAFIGVPLQFVYKGGGSHPVAGMDYIAGGTSNISPVDIGIPSTAAFRTQKLIDKFKIVLASFKD